MKDPLKVLCEIYLEQYGIKAEVTTSIGRKEKNITEEKPA